MSSSALESGKNRFLRLSPAELIFFDEKHHIHEITNSAVRILGAWKRVCMKLFGKLLLSGNDRYGGCRDFRKA